jgi:hypothetical protein
MLTDLRLDSPGIAALLKSGPFAAAVHEVAEGIASDVRGSVPADVEVVVDDYTTDRAASSVTIKDARGALWQARDGVLTRAASGSGVEVTDRA